MAEKNFNKKLSWSLIIFFLATSFAQVRAQESPDDESSRFTFFGYVSYEAIFDSHRSIFTRDGELYLFPSAPVYHPETGEMLNRNAQLNMLSLQSRLGVRIAGPEVLGARLTGFVDTDFFATAEAYKHHLRVRNAIMRLQWDKASLTMGQFWHPMFTPELFPMVVSFGAAAPFNPLNRSPQIRLDYLPNPSVKLVFAALAHGYHASLGSESVQRDSGLPDVQFQLHIGNKPHLTTGITLGYMWLKPLETTQAGQYYHSNELLGAYNLQWFGRVKSSNLTLQAKAMYGENMTQYVMIGGYSRLLEDAGKTDGFGYTNINSFSGLLEAIYQLSNNWEFGLFAGSIGALGSNEKIEVDGPFWHTRAANLSRAYRISPRLVYTQQNLMFAIEYLYNTADYGSSFDDYGKPKDLSRTINHRALFAARYSF